MSVAQPPNHLFEVDFLHVSGPRMQIEDRDGGGRLSLDGEDRFCKGAVSVASVDSRVSAEFP